MKLASPVRTIVVVTSIPREIDVGYQGFTVFENEDEQIDVGDWRLQDVAINAAKEQLASRFAVRTVSWASPPLDRAFSTEEVGKSLEDQKATLGPADLYLVISPEYWTGQLETPRVGFHGFGISKLGNIFVTRPPIVHSFGIAALYEGGTFKLLATRLLKLDHASRDLLWSANPDVKTELLMLGQHDEYIPAAPLTEPTWTGGWKNLSEAQRNEARQTMSKLVDLSVRFTLDHMFEPAGGPGVSP